MHYATIKKNDIANGTGIRVSLFVSGCTHHCKNCFNPETWDFNGGKEFTPQVLEDIYEALDANKIERNFCIMGGEPLCQENLFLTLLVLRQVKQRFPNVKIYLWTGYYYKDLIHNIDSHMKQILELVDVLIDGPYDQSLRDVTLKMRGSSNQSIINLKEKNNGSKLC